MLSEVEKLEMSTLCCKIQKGFGVLGWSDRVHISCIKYFFEQNAFLFHLEISGYVEKVIKAALSSCEHHAALRVVSGNQSQRKGLAGRALPLRLYECKVPDGCSDYCSFFLSCLQRIATGLGLGGCRRFSFIQGMMSSRKRENKLPTLYVSSKLSEKNWHSLSANAFSMEELHILAYKYITGIKKYGQFSIKSRDQQCFQVSVEQWIFLTSKILWFLQNHRALQLCGRSSSINGCVADQ